MVAECTDPLALVRRFMAENEQVELEETEEALIQKAQQAMSRCNWVVGECASKWTERYAQGRTDADFGRLVGMSGDQVYQRRRVWETFADTYQNFPSLRWSHFYVALNWDDAEEILNWAEEQQTTVSEMKAWRRLQHGEDLRTPAEETPTDDMIAYVPTETTMVRDPGEFSREGGESVPFTADEGAERPATVAGVARDVEQPAGGEYTPFRKEARGVPATEKDSDVAVVERPQPSPDQVIRRLTVALERCNNALTPEVMQEFSKLPDDIKQRFTKATKKLLVKAGKLGLS